MKILFVLVLISVLPGCITVGVDYRLNNSTSVSLKTDFKTIGVSLKGR